MGLAKHHGVASLRRRITEANAPTQRVHRIAGGLASVVNAAFLDTQDQHKLQSLLEDDLPEGEPTGAVYESHSTSIIDTLSELKRKGEEQAQKLQAEETSRRHAFEMLEQG